jgi:hypothetical protein
MTKILDANTSRSPTMLRVRTALSPIKMSVVAESGGYEQAAGAKAKKTHNPEKKPL